MTLPPRSNFIWTLLSLLFVIGCTTGSPDKEELKLFSALSSNRSGVDFENKLKFIQQFNIYTYRNFYNGGGVGIGDVNNDGFVDIYFTSNMDDNKLYLNHGDLTFTDVTDRSGVAGQRSWSTGVSMVDINSDGWLDIYVCNSGDIDGDNKQNELFINQQDGTFIEEAEKYGIADRGYTTHAAFFDYDRDDDLDLYMLNNSFQAIGSFNLRKNERPVRNPEGGDKFFRNDNGTFVDISEEAGIYGSIIGFGLGVTVGDIDLDGWQDMYISNDFFERDYIYMNNGDGTFSETLETQMRSISGASMGADMADINNDGYPDIFVTEMLPEPNDRLKTKTTFENWDKYQYNLQNGYYHQFTRNMLHLNNGNRTFSEIGRLAGVEATDWSWGALICDFDNDGLRDLFIANGIYKDLTDQDYINYISTEEMARSVISKEGVDFQTLTEVIPSNKIPNYMYRNKGRYQFEKVTDEWGLGTPSHSNGSAYADLDNDGDMDLVINNVNETASIYINNAETIKPENNYLKVTLSGKTKNTQGLGTRLVAHIGKEQIFHEQMPVRGFQSSIDPRPHFGIGKRSIIDSLEVFWPDGKETTLYQIQANQIVEVKYSDGKEKEGDLGVSNVVREKWFVDITDQSNIDFQHKENDFVDFDRDRLIYHMLSAEGPALCSGDFNGDGRTDFFVGGATDQPGGMFLQTRKSTFARSNKALLEVDKNSEDVDCACFDADSDGDIDIYVASGGNEFPNSSSSLIDRLYLNTGRGQFIKSDQILPSFKFENSSCVRPSDIDSDGDLDLFVGVRARPLLYGVPADGYMLRNVGHGKFTNISNQITSEFKELGLVTDASWVDFDGDKDQDLLVVGEWMSIKLFENKSGRLQNVSKAVGLDSTDGWWNKIHPVDIDGDGDIDFILGNHGLNSRFKASRKKPVKLYVNDFDQNGSPEAIICVYFGEESYPLALKHDLIGQLPLLKKKYVQYEAYKDQTITDIFTPEQLENAVSANAFIMETSLLLNHNSHFELKTLPVEAQMAPVYAIATDDFDGDGNIDILLGGNFYYAKPEVGRYDASYGVLLKGKGDGTFDPVENRETGLMIEDEVREFRIIRGSGKNLLLAGRNNQSLKLYSY